MRRAERATVGKDQTRTVQDPTVDRQIGEPTRDTPDIAGYILRLQV